MTTPNLNKRTDKNGTWNVNKKWLTKTIYIDIDTGEILTKSIFKRDYIKFNSTKKIIQDEKYNIKEYLITGKRGKQLSLW